jgi:hypothetical protein
MAVADAAARAIAPAAPADVVNLVRADAAADGTGRRTPDSREGAGPSAEADAGRADVAGAPLRDAASASQCPICYEPMAAKVPHIYPCGHVYCRECSEKVRSTCRTACADQSGTASAYTRLCGLKDI